MRLSARHVIQLKEHANAKMKKRIKEKPRGILKTVKTAAACSKLQEVQEIMVHQIQAQIFMQIQTIFQADGAGATV